MEIKNFNATVELTVNWVGDRYWHFGSDAVLKINSIAVPDGTDVVLNDGDSVSCETLCNVISGVARDVEYIERDRSKYIRFVLVDAVFNGAYNGAPGDYCGFNWKRTRIPDNAKIRTSINPRLRTWGGYKRFREQLYELSGGQTTIGGDGVSSAVAERAAKDFISNRPLSL